MKHPTCLRPAPCCLLLFVLLLAAAPACAQIAVQGIADQTVYADEATFTVTTQAGWTYDAALNGTAVAVGTAVNVKGADYYELFVHRRNNTTSAQESTTFQFIIRSSERRNSEWGLSPWVPYPVIPSAAAEFAGSHLKVIAPEAFPQGLDIPIVIWVEDATGKRVGANGVVTAAGIPNHQLVLRRGVGAGYLPTAPAGETIHYAPQVQTLSVATDIQIEASTTWTTVSGNIGSTTNWGENARIHVSGDLTVAAGATLTIGEGGVIRLAAGVEIFVDGTLRVNGTIGRPVVFTPQSKNAQWGGIRFKTAASLGEMAGAILTGSGADPDWFGNNAGSGSSHRGEEPCIYLSGGSRVNLTDCALIDGKGQAGHGESSFFNMTRCLVERFITCGQYNAGSVNFSGCAILEFPYDGAPFADVDNDAVYLTGGAHTLTDCLVGWALDDGVDSGSGSGGPVTVTRCWFESCFHEGMAWSESRLPTVRDTVSINNGQGIECGFGSPMVDADHILSTANLNGARFGDNYDWDYNGFLTVTNSLILYNRRDIWGRAWDNWTEHLSQMDLHGNFLTAADPLHTSNAVWNPAADSSRLVPFLPVPAGTVGVGIAVREDKLDISQVVDGVPFRLSSFTTSTVTVSYSVDTDAGPAPGGSVDFVPGETVKRVQLALPELASLNRVRVTLGTATGAEITGRSDVSYIRTIPVTLIATGSVWKYHDGGTSQGTAWRELGFNDTAWKSGPAELGFDEGDEATLVNGGPATARFPTIYFRHRIRVADPLIFDSLLIRLRRDDGAVVYLNGVEVFRSNMPEGTVSYTTLSDGTTDSETAFYPEEIGPEELLAGDNVVAVEVHQAALDSSDLSFELELIGNSVPDVPVAGFLRGDANGDGTIDISDALKTLFVLFRGAATNCEDSLDADDDGSMAIGDAIYILAYLFRSGPAMPVPFLAAGDDPTADVLDCAR